MKISKGQIVALTSGEYSDYCLRDHMRAVVDFDAQEQVVRFKREGDYNDKNDRHYGSEERFMAWLVRENLLEPLEDNSVVEFYLGDYGALDIRVGNE